MQSQAFTLIELLIVIVLIGILSALGVASFSGYFSDARQAGAYAEIAQINKAIKLLEVDAGLSPGGIPITPCVDGREIQLSDCSAGLNCNDGTFTTWNGPYVNLEFLDPWGNDYWLDTDFHCDQGANNAPGCAGYEGLTVRAITSAGPDNTPQSIPGEPGTDDIVLVLCS